MTSRRHTLLSISTAVGLTLAFMMVGLRCYNGYLDKKLVARQMELNNIQTEINRGKVSQQLLQNLVNDLAPMAPGKSELQNLLARYNITISKPTGNPTP